MSILSAEASKQDSTSDGLKDGFAESNSAAAAETNGAEKDVPFFTEVPLLGASDHI